MTAPVAGGEAAIRECWVASFAIRMALEGYRVDIVRIVA